MPMFGCALTCTGWLIDETGEIGLGDSVDRLCEVIENIKTSHENEITRAAIEYPFFNVTQENINGIKKIPIANSTLTSRGSTKVSFGLPHFGQHKALLDIAFLQSEHSITFIA
jgi:hypothetical protein